MPRILEMLNRPDGRLAAVPHDDCLRVFMVLLSDFHEASRVHEAIRMKLGRLEKPVLPASLATWASETTTRVDEQMLRRLMGLHDEGAQAIDNTDVGVEASVGLAGSDMRAMLLTHVEQSLGISLSPSQRKVIMEWCRSVLEVPAAPGTGKIHLWK